MRDPLLDLVRACRFRDGLLDKLMILDEPSTSLSPVGHACSFVTFSPRSCRGICERLSLVLRIRCLVFIGTNGFFGSRLVSLIWLVIFLGPDLYNLSLRRHFLAGSFRFLTNNLASLLLCFVLILIKFCPFSLLPFLYRRPPDPHLTSDQSNQRHQSDSPLFAGQADQLDSADRCLHTHRD